MSLGTLGSHACRGSQMHEKPAGQAAPVVIDISIAQHHTTTSENYIFSKKPPRVPMHSPQSSQMSMPPGQGSQPYNATEEGMLRKSALDREGLQTGFKQHKNIFPCIHPSYMPQRCVACQEHSCQWGDASWTRPRGGLVWQR